MAKKLSGANCPSKNELREFGVGETDDHRFEEIARHVETCDVCLRLIAEVDSYSLFPAVDETRNSYATEQDCLHAIDFVVGLPNQHSDPIPEQVGNYRIVSRIGAGGMGIVYMAEQKQPLRRKVALKIIKPGMDTHEVITRFEIERQALAMMDHQNIAKVLDAGTTDSGHPYFVMDFVDGIPITTFCDENKLTTRERLHLFVTVCEAVQHAHQKGVIHRDLKPSNVIVTLNDGQPIAKVIDFGVAKAINRGLTEKTLFTE